LDLVIVRHALPVRRIAEEGAAADPELTELGHRQAAATANWLADESFDALYTSPMLRAVQTAAPIASKHGLEAIPSDGIAEYDRQSGFYIPLEEVKASDDPEIKAHWQALAEDRLEDVIADAHTFKPRVIEAFQHIIDAHPGGRVLAVCHGGVINVALGWILDHPRTLWFEPAYASIHRVAASRAGIRSIVSINETGHLRGVQ
jgi:probable phosphoglycerate mutase